MKDLLKFLLKKITKGDKFEIEESENGEIQEFKVKVPQESMGIVIGKGGNTIKAIRNLLKVKATLEKKVVNLSLEE